MTISRTFDLLTLAKEKFNRPNFLNFKVNGRWQGYSTQDYIDAVDNLSLALIALGIQRNDKIAIISNNRPEWNIVDMAISQVAAVSVPIYPTISSADYEFILNHAEVKLIFLSDKVILEKIQPILPKLSYAKHIFSFDYIENTKHISSLFHLADKLHLSELSSRKQEVKPENLLTIIYTSGTTGNPKGVMLSHRNLVSNFMAGAKLCPLNEHKKVLSFLPLCHIFERMLVYMYQYLGTSIYYAESIDTIGDNLKEIKPNAFTTVPRLLEKVYDKIYAKGSEAPFFKRMLFFWALNLGLNYGKSQSLNYRFQLYLANKLVFSKWRAALGGNIDFIVSGGAALQPRLARVFTAAKIIILEGYGLTETSPVVAVNHVPAKDRKIGTVGLVLEKTEVKIADDGEILCKGPNVMMGYYKRPDLTKEAIDEDGWFHTGDIGCFEDGRFLKITDRKKEIFKTSGGKYVAPQIIENKLKESIFIEQIMVVGEHQKFVAALIVPNFEVLTEWCRRKELPFIDKATAISNPIIIKRYQKEIDKYNLEFGKVEQIKKFTLLADNWSIESGELTPTLKLKRKFIAQKYARLIAELYAV